MLFEVEQAANRIRSEVDPDANIIFGNTILEDMEGRIRVSVVATGIDAEQMRMPLPEKVRPLHPHLNLKPQARTVQPVAPAPQYQSGANPVHATMDALASGIGAEKSPAEDYILGGEDAPEVEAAPLSAKYPVTESYRPVAEQPLAPRAAEEKKSGWGFFGRKKAAPDMRAEPAARTARRRAPRHGPDQPPMPQPEQAEAPRGKDDDLFPDHKRDEQFEIPAFLRRQSN